MKTPARCNWAVDLLAVTPGRRILEIGCGRGHVAHVLAPKLGVGGYVGIDRSKVAIEAARKLNAEAEGRGIARFVLGSLGEADTGAKLFDDILAVNVNAFWTDEGEAAASALALLKRRGRMLLVHELPSPDHMPRVTDAIERNLRASGFLTLNAVKAAPPHKALFAMWARRG